MSRIGKLPVAIPDQVKVSKKGEETLLVEGPRGKLENSFHEAIKIEIKDNSVIVERGSDEKKQKALHGLTRALIQNMVTGVSQGFEKKLEIIGVGYNSKLEGKNLVLNIGFCHPVKMPLPQGIEVETPSNTQITIKGIDKQLVGQFAANIRRVRPPEPYKGKGIRYEGEFVARKIGKAFGKK